MNTKDLFGNETAMDGAVPGKTCKDCSHVFSVKFRSGKVISFCEKRRSSRDKNLHLKVKRERLACSFYETKEIKDVN